MLSKFLCISDAEENKNKRNIGLKIQELVKINWWFDFTNIIFCKNLKFTCAVDKGMIKHIIASRQTSSVNSIFSDQIKGVFQKHNSNVVTQTFLIKFGMRNELGHVIIILEIFLFQIGESNSDLQLSGKRLKYCRFHIG